MGERLPGAIPDGDHRGTGQAPPQRHILRDDHPIEGGRLTTGNQTTSPWTPHPSCLYLPQEWQWKGVSGSQKHT